MLRPGLHPSERRSRFLVWATSVFGPLGVPGGFDEPAAASGSNGIEALIQARFLPEDAGWRAFRSAGRIWFQRPFPTPVTIEYYDDSEGIFVVMPGLHAIGDRLDPTEARSAIVPALFRHVRRAPRLSMWERRHLLDLVQV